MKIELIRLFNARHLAKQAGSDVAFGESIGVDASRVSQLIGKKPTRNIGRATTKRIEAAFGVTDGWMDEIHPEVGYTAASSPAAVGPAKRAPTKISLTMPKGQPSAFANDAHAAGIGPSDVIGENADLVSVEELTKMISLFCRLKRPARDNIMKSAEVALTIPLPSRRVRRD